MSGLVVYIENSDPIEQICNRINCVLYDIQEIVGKWVKVVLYGEIVHIATSLNDLRVQYMIGLSRE